MPADGTTSGTRLMRSAASATNAIETVGDAWSWLVLREAVLYDVTRFDLLRDNLGIARSTLTARLVGLVGGGLLVKEPDPDRPGHTHYAPTDMGWDFFGCLITSMQWGIDWADGSEQPRVLMHTACGARIGADLVCHACRVPLRAKQVRLWLTEPVKAVTVPAQPRTRTPELSLLERRRPCSIARTLKVIGDRWSSLILRSSLFDIKRFDDFRATLGIAESILVQRLGRLMELGVLTRRPYQSNPPRYEYVLTEKGLALYPIYLSMVAWGDRWLPSADAPGMVLEHKPCGHSVEPALACATCRGPIEPGAISS